MNKPEGRGRDILQGLVAAGKPTRPADGTLPQARPAGAVKAMSLGLDRLSSEAAQARNSERSWPAVRPTRSLTLRSSVHR